MINDLVLCGWTIDFIAADPKMKSILGIRAKKEGTTVYLWLPEYGEDVSLAVERQKPPEVSP